MLRQDFFQEDGGAVLRRPRDGLIQRIPPLCYIHPRCISSGVTAGLTRRTGPGSDVRRRI